MASSTKKKYTRNPNTGWPMKAIWVAARYTGEQAKNVLGLANEGAGYHVLERPDQGTAWVKVAFLKPLDDATPEHLVEITSPSLLKRLNEQRQARKGTKVRS